jgi:phosphoglycerate dehydrogenase-like enzyme
MKLIGIRRSPTGNELIPTYPISEIDAVLSQADHVINILPANADSHQFFDRTRLSKIRPGAFFYNIGRGSTVDQQALADALNEGSLSGAYLDVMAPEPLPSDHFLWTVPNCYITPHTAGGFDAEMSRLVEHFLDNFQRYRSGQPLLNRVL